MFDRKTKSLKGKELARISHEEIEKGCHFWHKHFWEKDLRQRRRTAFS